MKPAAWVRNLTDPQPHCVTDLTYMSAADVDAGVQYVPLYAAPEQLQLEKKDKNFERLADYLDDNARSPQDNEAAALLRKLGRVAEVAYEMVWARTHEQSKAAYVEMIDLIKGKSYE